MTSDRDDLDFSGTRPVAEHLQFDAQAIEEYLAAQLEEFAGPVQVRQFKGGQSNPTYLIITPGKRYVLRRRPPGKLLPSAHAVDREFRVISALHAHGFPVPRPHLLCADESIAGTMFYIMDYVEGRILWDPHLRDLAADQRASLYDVMNATVARLHRIDYEAIGLGDYGKPGNYFARQISRWSRQYAASQTENIPAMKAVMDWLPGNIPDDDSTSIVHGDFRLDNLILHASRPEILAVLDWELSTLGHPLGDFTYHLMPWYLPAGISVGGIVSLKTADLPALGIPSEDEYVSAYCERTGRDGIEERDFFKAYNLFRIAAILQGIAGRVRDGTAASEHATQLAQYVRPLAEEAWRYARAAD